MKKPLLDVIFASDKRKNVLRLLQDGPQEMEYILGQLDTTRQALLPQMRILEDHYLVTDSKDIYELTTIGKLVASKMIPLLNVIESFDVDIDFWGTLNLDFIPSHLLKKFFKLEHIVIEDPKLHNIYEINQQFFERTEMSKSLISITSFLRSDFAQNFPKWIANGMQMSYVISLKLLEKLQMESNEELRNFIENGDVKLYLYPHEFNLAAFGQNDYCIIFRVLDIKGEVDNRRLLLYGQDALAWGKDFFEHYLRDSTPIIEL